MAWLDGGWRPPSAAPTQVSTNSQLTACCTPTPTSVIPRPGRCPAHPGPFGCRGPLPSTPSTAQPLCWAPLGSPPRGNRAQGHPSGRVLRLHGGRSQVRTRGWHSAGIQTAMGPGASDGPLKHTHPSEDTPVPGHSGAKASVPAQAIWGGLNKSTLRWWHPTCIEVQPPAPTPVSVQLPCDAPRLLCDFQKGFLEDAP